MPEYIDLTAARAFVEANYQGDPLLRHLYGTLLDKLPRVEAVEVVRCKDCKHSVWDEENEMWKCVESAEYDERTGEWFGFYEYHNGDFFCADGERKDND